MTHSERELAWTMEDLQERRRMLATWPVMLKALKAAQEYMEFISYPNVEPYPLHEIRVAITEAEGRVE